MKPLLFCLTVLVVISGACRCFALDWKTLHEQADTTDLRTAMQRVDHDPKSADNLYVLGLVCLDLYQTRQADQSFDRLIGLFPEIKEGLWGKAEVLRRYHRYAESEAILTRLIKEYPDYCPSYLTLAYIRFIQMRFGDSADLAFKVMRRNKRDLDLVNYSRSHLLYAGAKGMLAHRGNPVSRIVNGVVVLPALRKAQAMTPDRPEVLYGFGSYYLLAPRGLGKNIHLAKEYLERMVEADPQFPDGFVRLAQVYKITGDEKKYEKMLATALQLDPQSELGLDVKNHTCRYICPEKE